MRYILYISLTLILCYCQITISDQDDPTAGTSSSSLPENISSSTPIDSNGQSSSFLAQSSSSSLHPSSSSVMQSSSELQNQSSSIQIYSSIPQSSSDIVLSSIQESSSSQPNVSSSSLPSSSSVGISSVVIDPQATFPLPEGYFQPAGMDMHLVYPRPDDETQIHARHRWAHPDMPYEIPIGVQGGAWPFKYELISGPSGASIGSMHNDPNYGTFQWKPSPSQSGSFTVHVKITDQELNTVTAIWTISIDSDKFLFIQDGAQLGGTGTIDNPLEDISDWYKGDENDDTYHNRIIVLRGGHYSLFGDPDRNNNIRLNESSKTPSIIGFPGEKAIVDCAQSKIFTDIDQIHDLFIADITWENGRQDVNNAHFFWAIGDVTRSTWWRNEFRNLKPGLVGNDNTCAVFVSATDKVKTNILYKENLHDGIENQGFNGAYFEAYVSSYVLVEQNIARNSATNAGFHAKGTISYTTIRANEMWDNVSGNQLGVGYGGEAREVPHDHEVCWNRVVVDSRTKLTAMWAHSNVFENQTYNSWFYRNTIVGGSTWIRFQGKEPFHTDGNVIVNDFHSRWNTDIMETSSPNLIGTPEDNATDHTGSLIGAFRDEWFGRAGFEIYSD